MNYELFISCGDLSADLHSANLIRAIKKFEPKLRITAIGGEELKKVSDNFLFNLVELNLHGFWEPVKHYFKLKNLLNQTIYNYLRSNRPAAVIPVDFYGFNINLCRISHDLNLNVLYYISPQVWATRPNRINQLKKYINHMFVIFQFEEKIYRTAGIPTTFVGHPLLDLIPEEIQIQDSSLQKFRIVEQKLEIGLFPGSRKQVINWNLPIFLQTARIIKQSFQEVNFTIVGIESLKECYKNCNSINVNFDNNYNSRLKFDIAISTSGTVTLENALLGIPMIVIYRLPWSMYFLIKSIIKVSTITIVNLIAGEQIIPEFIQSKANPRNIAKLILKWLKNKNILVEIKHKYKQIRNMLGEPGSYDRTAKLILEKI